MYLIVRVDEDGLRSCIVQDYTKYTYSQSKEYFVLEKGGNRVAEKKSGDEKLSIRQ